MTGGDAMATTILAETIFDLRDDPADATAGLRGECVAGCRWRVRAVRLGLNRNGDRYPQALGPAFVRLLPLVAVRAAWIEERFQHPPLEEAVTDPRSLAGFVEAASVEASSVFAIVHLFHDVSRLRRALLAMERDGLLHRLAGLSIQCRVGVGVDSATPGGDLITGVHVVEALDLVSRPGGYEACVLRSLPLESAVSD